MGGVRAECAAVAMGPSRVGELLLVDVRVARLVPRESRLWGIFEPLVQVDSCEVVGKTLVIDLLSVRKREDREYILDVKNWPTP